MKYLEVKYWLELLGRVQQYFIPGPYLMDPISCDFF